jgi:rhodanese-related sulfurtransferase
VIKRGNKALSVTGFEAMANDLEVLILDTRSPQEFAKGFIPNSINIGINGGFAVWVGTLVPDIKQEIIFIADAGKEQEVITRLARVGYDHAIGYLEGGFEAWKKAGKETDVIPSVSVAEFARAEMNDPAIPILDVRKKSEYNAEHIANAISAPLDFINDSMLLIDRNKKYYVHCAGGYRSMIFASILKARGYDNLIDVDGGFKAIKESGKFAVTDYVCPATML